VIVVRTDAFLSSGLPVGRIDRITEIPAQKKSSVRWIRPMARLLQEHLATAEPSPPARI
jgi:hypothetical protein